MIQKDVQDKTETNLTIIVTIALILKDGQTDIKRACDGSCGVDMQYGAQKPYRSFNLRQKRHDLISLNSLMGVWKLSLVYIIANLKPL